MPAHHPHSGIPPRRSRRPAAWAAAAAFAALAVSACSSSASCTAPASAVSTVPGGHALILAGSGSTFNAPFFTAAFPRYEQQHPGVTISYSSVKSSAGIAAFSAGQVSFGASDVSMTVSEQAAAKGGPAAQAPVDLGGEGVVYHLPSQPRPACTCPARSSQRSSSARSPAGTPLPSPR